MAELEGDEQMSKGLLRAVGLTCLTGFLALATEAQGAATVSLRAVAKNGVPITPTNNLAIAPNDTITAELFFFGWNSPPYDGSTGLVKTFQVTLAGRAGVISNGAAPTELAKMVLPTTWNAPLDRVSCPCTAPFECSATFGPQYGCTLPGFNPNTMASITTSRFDFILNEYPNISSESEASLDIRWGGTIDGNDGVTASRCVGGQIPGASCLVSGDCAGGTCNQSFLSYAGTLNLKAGAEVCGTTTFTLVSDVSSTFLSPPGFIPAPVLPAIQGLTLVAANQCVGSTGACCNDATGVCQDNVLQANCSGRWGGAGSTCANINPPCVAPANTPIAWNPPPCAVDARRPYPPNTPASREGFISWAWTFQNTPGSGEDAPNDFTIRQVPATTPPVPPSIGSVNVAGNTVTLNFRNAANTANFPIQTNRWTCVKHNASNVEKCLGALPADANSNLTAAPTDILDIIDNLNGVRVPPLVIYQCDIDRSGACAPADIITEIDLLNSVNGFPANQLGRQLDACPAP